ncbi:hypothetical protein ACE01N_20125 [Saccharicrinis sp. FJH2]|uniref:hypothetical protein n=1 Tax=Saccharicrinis sp. FJH65 TaxID=3344659 RepID=UPI0035F3434E
MINRLIIIFFVTIIGIIISACSSGETSYKKPDFISTDFKDDTANYKLRQLIDNPNGDDFIAVFFKESSMSFGSGGKIIKLYNKDSISIDECYYGAHPLIAKTWLDSTIILECKVYSAHGDSINRRKYLDSSVDKNDIIGHYHIDYIKNYNAFNE